MLSGCGSTQPEPPPFTEPPATGPLVEITPLDAEGNPLPSQQVNSVVLSGEQWRARLTPLGFAVLRVSDT
jgi:hypothetical protein